MTKTTVRLTKFIGEKKAIKDIWGKDCSKIVGAVTRDKNISGFTTVANL